MSGRVTGSPKDLEGIGKLKKCLVQPFSSKWKQVSLESWAIFGLGQGERKMSVEHLSEPGHKEVL